MGRGSARPAARDLHRGGAARGHRGGFRARFGRALAQALGIIEVGLPVLNAASAESKPTALGRPLPAYDVWLRDDDGKPVLGPGSPERTGEICIRGPGLFDAYLSP
jgi:acyl-CoA synthetase (AMP-forming)/AMP-acid ligase II